MPQPQNLNNPLDTTDRIVDALNRDPGLRLLVERLVIAQSTEVRKAVENVLDSFGVRRSPAGTSSTPFTDRDLRKMEEHRRNEQIEELFSLGVPVKFPEMIERKEGQSLTEFLIEVMKAKKIISLPQNKKDIFAKLQDLNARVLENEEDYRQQLQLTMEYQKWSFVLTLDGSIVELLHTGGVVIAYVHSCRDASKRSSN